MPVTLETGDMFSCGARTLVCPVNCVGVMGKGVAAEFRDRFPIYGDHYVSICNIGWVRSGVPIVFRYEDYRWASEDGTVTAIVSFPTKYHWKNGSRIEWIEGGIQLLSRMQLPQPIAIPALGCGLGGLSWDDVEPVLRRMDHPLSDIRIFAPR